MIIPLIPPAVLLRTRVSNTVSTGSAAMKKSLYIFDLDGTLVDAYQAIRESLNSALKTLGYGPVSYSIVKKSVGEGINVFINKFFVREDYEKALSLYRRHHARNLDHKIFLRPEAEETLSALKRRGRIVAVASNRSQRFCSMILKRLKVIKYVDFLLCADKVGKIKPDPEIVFRILKKFKIPQEEAVFVGDMDIDLETAERAGIDGIFIKGGSSPLGKVKKRFKGVNVIASLSEVISFYG